MLLIEILDDLKTRFTVWGRRIIRPKLAGQAHGNVAALCSRGCINHGISCLRLTCPSFPQQLLCACGAFRLSSPHPPQSSGALINIKMEYRGIGQPACGKRGNTRLGPSHGHLRSLVFKSDSPFISSSSSPRAECPETRFPGCWTANSASLTPSRR